MKRNKVIILMMTMILMIPLAGCIFIEEDSLILGSRNNTESIILSHVIGQLIEEETDLEVIYKENLGGSNVVWDAMINDNIDVIPDYTGTIVLTYYHEEPGTAEETLAQTKKLVAEDGIVAFNTFGFNNTYTLALDETKAEELDVVTFSDFAEVSDQFTLGAVFEYDLDYTGTIVLTYYHEEPGTAEETLAQTKKLVAEDGIVAFNTFGFNNTYTLALDETKAEELDVVTFSDFAEVSDQFTLGAVFEFIDRPDGLPGFEEAYDLEFKDVKGMDHGMMYRAINGNEVDVINSYTTDGQLQMYDLRVLEDDESFFPPYHALPLVREEALDEYPELEDVLRQLEGQIDEETMQGMNAKVDNENMMVEIVAKEFLQESGLVD